MARSYNVSFNINGNAGSLLSALQNAAAAMRNLGSISRAMQDRLNRYGQTQQAAQGVLKNIQAYQNLSAAYRDNVRRQAQLQLRNVQLNAQRQLEERKLADMRVGYDNLRQARTRLNKELRQAVKSGTAEEAVRLKDAVTQINAAIKQGSAEIKAQQQTIKNIGKEFDLNSRNAQKLRETLAQQQQQLSQLRTRIPSSNLAAAEAALRAQINQTTAALEREIAALQRRAQVQNNFNQASQNMSNAYNNFQGALQTAETIASPFKSAVENAMTFEHAMSRVKALTQSQNIREGRTSQVDAEMQMLTQQARDLGATTMFTSTQAAQAMGYLGMAGWKTAQIYGTMPGMLNLAAAAGADLAQTADIVSDNMTAMGVPVEQAGHFMDVYAYALTNSNARLADFGETMKYAAPVAKAYGATLDETAAMVMMMANAGIKGSMAGTSLRMGLLRLAGPPKTATKEMAKLGLSLSDAQAGAEEAAAVIQGLGIDLSGATSPGEKMTRVLMQLHEKTKDLSQDEKLAAFKGIFGVNAETGWLALFDQGPEVFLKYLQGLQNADGYSEQVAGTMVDDTQGALIMLQSAWDAFSERIGEALLPAVRSTIEALTPLVTAAAQWVEQHPAFVQACAAIAAGLASIVVAAAAVKLAFAGWQFIASSIQMVQWALTSLSEGALLGGLLGRIAALRTALFGLNGAATLGGWGAMFGAISTQAAAATTAIRTFFASLTVGSIVSSITTALSSLGTAIAGVARAAFAFAFSPVGVALMLLGAAAYYAYTHWDRLAPVLSNIAGIITGALSPALEQIKTAMNGFTSSGGFEALSNAASSLANVIGGTLVKAFVVLLTVAAQVIAGLIQLFADLLTIIFDFGTGLSEAFDKIKNGEFRGAFDALGEAGKKVSADITKLGDHAFDGFVQGAKNVQTALDALNMPKLPTQKVTARHSVTFDESAPAPALDTPATQAALDAVGDSAQTAATNMDALNLPTQDVTARHSLTFDESAPEPALDTSATQAALDAVGTSAQTAATNMDALNLPTQEVTARHSLTFDESAPEPALDTSATQAALDAVGTSAQTAATNMQSISNAGMNLQTFGMNLQTFGMNSQTAGLNVQTLGMNSQTAGLNVQQVGNAALMTAPQVDMLGTSSGMAFGNVDMLGSSAGMAGGQVGSMGAAADAVSAALSAKAAEIGAIHISIPTVSVGGAQPAAANYMGGIYRKGAFLTTFAERSAEAAIPLDGSKRAQDLWTQAGQILGLLPGTQSVTYDTPINPARPQPFNMPKIFTQTQPTTYPIFANIPPQLVNQDTGGLIGGVIAPSQPSQQTTTTLNVTINVNISGNADEQTVRRGVEEALPALDDWFTRYNEYQREERRRSFA